MTLPEKLHLEIATPERRVLARDVDEVILPGSEGSFGVLPGHHPMLAGLGPGVALCKTEGHSEVLAISGGFAEVGPDRVTVLAETCERAAEIDAGRARQKVADLQKELTREIPETEIDVLRMRILKHLARIDAVGRTS